MHFATRMPAFHIPMPVSLVVLLTGSGVEARRPWLGGNPFTGGPLQTNAQRVDVVTPAAPATPLALGKARGCADAVFPPDGASDADGECTSDTPNLTAPASPQLSKPTLAAAHATLDAAVVSLVAAQSLAPPPPPTEVVTETSCIGMCTLRDLRVNERCGARLVFQ